MQGLARWAGLSKFLDRKKAERKKRIVKKQTGKQGSIKIHPMVRAGLKSGLLVDHSEDITSLPGDDCVELILSTNKDREQKEVYEL